MKTPFVLALALLASSQAQADCSWKQISGNWTQTIPSREAAGSAQRITWQLSEGKLLSLLDGLDSYSKTSGPYFEYQTVYTVVLDSKTCILTAQATEAKSITYRNFEDPTPNASSWEGAGVGANFFKLQPTANALEVSRCGDDQCVEHETIPALQLRQQAQ